MKLFNFFKNLIKPRKKRKTGRKNKKPAAKLRKKSRSVTRRKSKKKTRKKLRSKPMKKLRRKLLRKALRKPRIKSQPKKVKNVQRSALTAKSGEKEIGVVTHYFDKISVGIIKLKAPLAVAETIRVKGAHDDFTQTVSSMQYNHKDITYAEKGLEIGIKVSQPVRENDRVYIVG